VRRALFEVDWIALSTPAGGGSRWAVLAGPGAGAVTAGLGEAAVTVGGHAGLRELVTAVAGGEPVPGVVVACGPVGASAAAGVHAAVCQVLGVVQAWLAEEAFASSVLMILTQGSVALSGDDGRGLDLAGAAVGGLVRSAQSENPGQLVLADVDGLQASWQALAGALGWGEPELAVRQGRVLGRRLARAAAPRDEAAAGAWRLDAAGDGTLGGLARIPAPEVEAPLGAGQVRVAVRAAGLNFRDTLITLGVYPGPASVGRGGRVIRAAGGPDHGDLGRRAGTSGGGR
jgi:hypothetical protein